MHEPMYDHPGVLDAIERVESWGVDFVDPRVEKGKAKIATEDILRILGLHGLAGEGKKSLDQSYGTQSHSVLLRHGLIRVV
jgi:phosphopantothenoylcysteine synthetase/decarboxylase